MRPASPRPLAIFTLLCLALGFGGARTDRPAEAASSADASDVVIAVVGSGIDYGHAAFGGAGSPDDYDANDPAIIETGSFPTARVIGGWDLAGARYSAACPIEIPADVLCSREPMPDPDPIDLPNGSGTRMAGIAAGLATAELPAGVASEARLVALKVRGQPIGVPATSALYDEAIDWVLDHNRGRAVPGAPAGGERIDVILLEASEPYAAGIAELEAAAARAAAEGVSIIAPVGDSGATPFGASGTASPTNVLSVAAALTEAPTTWGIRVDYVDASGMVVVEEHAALEGGDWLPQLVDVGPVEAELAWYGLACNDDAGAPTPPEQDVNGKIALIARGVCSFTDKMMNAAGAGALAVLMFSDQRDKVGPACGAGTCPVAPGIPGVMIDNAPGLALQALLEDGRRLTVKMDAGYEIEQRWLADTLVDSSSAGPVAAGGLAPDLVGPGFEIPSPDSGSGTGGRPWTASSAAAAHVAGLAALAQAQATAQGWRRTSLERAMVPALLASQAEPILHLQRSDTGPLAPVSRQGAGLVDAAVISRTRAVAHPPEDHGLAFGVVRIDEPRQLSGNVLLRRLGDGVLRLKPDFEFTRPADQRPTASVSVGRDILLDDRSSLEQAVSVRIDAAALPAWDLGNGQALADPDLLESHVIDGHFRYRAVDSAGAPLPDANPLSVPMQVLPRPSSCIRPDGLPSPRRGEPTRIGFGNRCPTAGRLRAMVLAASDPEEADTTASKRSRAIDIRAVGIRYGEVEIAEGEREAVLEFHVATAGSRSTPIGTAIDIYLDIDRDGHFDRVLTTAPGSALRDAQPSTWYTVDAPLIPGSLEPDLASSAPDPMPMRYDLAEAVSVLRVRAEALLLDFESGEEAFDFGLRMRDTLGHVPADAALPGYDLAPNELERGATYLFDQQAYECIEITDAGGEPAGAAGDDLPLSAGSGRSDILVNRRADCRADLSRGPYGLLLSYPDNADAVDQSDLWLMWRDGAPEQIYLPIGLNGSGLDEG